MKDQELLLEVGKVTHGYYAQADDLEVTGQHIADWLNGLPPGVQKGMSSKSREEILRSIPFRRFILELHDYGMEEYLKEHLSSDALIFWYKQKEDAA